MDRLSGRPSISSLTFSAARLERAPSIASRRVVVAALRAMASWPASTSRMIFCIVLTSSVCRSSKVNIFMRIERTKSGWRSSMLSSSFLRSSLDMALRTAAADFSPPVWFNARLTRSPTLEERHHPVFPLPQWEWTRALLVSPPQSRVGVRVDH